MDSASWRKLSKDLKWISHHVNKPEHGPQPFFLLAGMCQVQGELIGSDQVFFQCFSSPWYRCRHQTRLSHTVHMDAFQKGIYSKKKKTKSTFECRSYAFSFSFCSGPPTKCSSAARQRKVLIVQLGRCQ